LAWVVFVIDDMLTSAKWTGLTILRLFQDNTDNNCAHSFKADRGAMRELFFAFFSKPTFGDLLPFAKAGQYRANVFSE